MKWCVAMLVCLLSAGVGRADGDPAHHLPIFDAHIHYKEPAWEAFPVKSIIELMDRSGVAMGLVSSTPDEGTIMLWRYAPNRVVPELRPYHGEAGSATWTKAPDMAGYIEERLKAYPHQGIGEFHIHRLDRRDEPLFRKLIGMARARDIFLHVHAGVGPVDWLYSLDPDVKIIWAHAGLSTPATGVHAMMERHATLVADTSLRENDILDGDGGLDPMWEKILIGFQDRLMVGSDTWVNSQWDQYEEIIAAHRRYLALLPEDVAEKIAYKNAERFFGRKVSMALIGKR